MKKNKMKWWWKIKQNRTTKMEDILNRLDHLEIIKLDLMEVENNCIIQSRLILKINYYKCKNLKT